MDMPSSKVRKKDWSNLPYDIITSVSDSLGLVALLSLSGVCKDWRSASSTSSASIEYSPNRRPWLLVYGENEDSQCTLYSDTKEYTLDVPELQGATCIASKQGWLLFFRQGEGEGGKAEVFFLCPFTRAIINLPELALSEHFNHVATFSSPPTCQDCIVYIVNRSEDSESLELYAIRRGANTWTEHKYSYSQERIGANIVYPTHHGRTFYFLDDKNGAIQFPVKDDNNLQPYVHRYVVVDAKTHSKKDFLPFSAQKGCSEDLKRLSCLKDDYHSISICGTEVEVDSNIHVIAHQSFKASEENHRSVKGIWIHPRIFRIPSNYTW